MDPVPLLLLLLIVILILILRLLGSNDTCAVELASRGSWLQRIGNDERDQDQEQEHESDTGHTQKALGAPMLLIDPLHARVGGRTLLYFGGCDYFRLSWQPRIRRALRRGMERWGVNVAASRRTTGNRRLYEQLEQGLADFFEVESAVLVSSGYATGLAVGQALSGEFTHAFIDTRAHGALLDATLFLGCPVARFAHRDVSDLARRIGRTGRSSRVLVLTDGMFSHDGSVAPLRAYARLLGRNGRLLVDDAHGAGVLGEHGRGSAECEGVEDARLIRTITLSKAFGVYGGAILGFG